ncbi:MAG: O-antigen ligase family protein [Acidobacteria bacterium]|nr:O-antigen ligase family protein [Acidobacteriota bacterium]
MSLQRSVRLAAAAAALLALWVLVGDYHFPLVLRAALVVVCVAAAVRPAGALLAAAAIGPFANTIAELIGSAPLRGFEAVMLAFLGGWLLHPPPFAQTPAGRRVAGPALLLIAIVVASSLTLIFQLRAADPEFLAATMANLRGAYLWTADITGIVEGGNLIVGLLVLLAVVELTAQESGRVFALIAAMTAAAAAAAGLSALLALDIGVPSAVARQAAFGKARFSATIADVNAAGSYFVLMLGVAGGMAASTTGARRRWWVGAAIAMLVGLGLSGSRSALASAILVVGASALGLALRGGTRLRSALTPAAWTVAVLLAAAAAIAFLQSPLLAGSAMRRDFTVASARIIEARPAFGVGIGRYYTVSQLVLSPWLAALYGQEHAHNYFLQLTAEIGMVGLAALLWLLYRCLQPAVAALRDRSRDCVTAGLTTGLFAYLATCATGHPLLLQESGFPFWMVMALALATAAGRDRPEGLHDERDDRSAADGPHDGWRDGRGGGARRDRIRRLARDIVQASGRASVLARAFGPPPAGTQRFGLALPAMAILLVFVSIPFRLEPPRLRLDARHDGFGPWQADRDGRRYRQSGEYGSLFVGPEVTSLQLPVRRMPGLPDRRLTLVDQEPNWTMHRTALGDGWTIVDITLPGAAPLMPYQRINLSIFDGDGSPADPRASGAAVGEILITGVRE